MTYKKLTARQADKIMTMRAGKGGLRDGLLAAVRALKPGEALLWDLSGKDGFYIQAQRLRMRLRSERHARHYCVNLTTDRKQALITIKKATKA
jgi:hypothetical protein